MAKRKPPDTLESQENLMIALATDLAEKQLREGTASAQVISHYLKLGSSRERLEQERLSRENTLLEARSDQMASARRIEDLYEKALESMRAYSGSELAEEEEFD